MEAEQPLGQPHAAGGPFVQVDRGVAGVRRADLVDAAEVVGIAHQIERGDVVQRVGHRGEGALETVVAPHLRLLRPFGPRNDGRPAPRDD